MKSSSEALARQQWIKGGMMNGTDDTAMRSLLSFLPAAQLPYVREYMSELWVRGISKRRFLKDMDLVRHRGEPVLSNEKLAQRKAIKAGQMNGDNDAVMKGLLANLPTTRAASTGNLHLARGYMAELWLRGVSKRQFVSKMGL